MDGTNNWSLSDIATAMRGSDGNGIAGGDFLILILLFFMLSGGNIFGNRSNAVNDYATSATQQDILFGQKFAEVNTGINKIGDGLASLGYEQLRQSDANTASINGNITSESRAIQSQLCAINSNIDNKFAALEKSQLEQTIASLNSKISTLEMQSAMCGVMRYPTTSSYAYSLPVANCGCSGNV